MSNIDLSSRKVLLLYDLLDALQKETGKLRIDWLHLIACATDPNGDSKYKLALRPNNKTWGIKKTRIEPIYSTPWTDSYVSHPRGTRHTGDKHVSYFVDWNFEESVLVNFKEEPLSIQEPKGLRALLNKEGIQIYRDDFCTWCKSASYPLPRFWFSEEQSKHVPPPSKQSHSKKPLETELTDIVSKLFWGSPPPTGHNRPTKTQIVDWLMEYAAADGLTEKAAARIFTSSRPEHIPKHGNLPHDKKPFPLPPYPTK